MLEQSITRVGKIVIGTAIFAIFLSFIAVGITYFRTGRINAMTLLSGLIIPLITIMFVTMKKNHKK